MSAASIFALCDDDLGQMNRQEDNGLLHNALRQSDRCVGTPISYNQQRIELRLCH
jgi:hypothetical protein